MSLWTNLLMPLVARHILRNPPHDADKETIDSGFVQVRGAREHNLKDISVRIPRNQLVVFTGVSGSGKSSLAFGTLYAEAQRRYFESVSPYARRLIDQVGMPDVDSIEGLPPAVALQQQRGTPSARSSVGSLTGVSSLLRMLYSRAGTYPARQPMLFAEDFSANTPQGACPECRGMGRKYTMTEKSMVPDPSLTIRERAIAAWPTAWGGQNLRDILVSLGYDVDKPWKDLPKKDRNWILFTDEQPVVPVYAGFTPAETRQALRQKMEPSYQGTFSSAKRNLEYTLANTQSPQMRKRVLKYMLAENCPVCDGKRLKRESLSVTFAGQDIAAISRLSLSQLADIMRAYAAGSPQPEQDHGRGISGEASRAAKKKRMEAGGASHDGAPDVRRTGNSSPEKILAAQRLCGELLERLDALIELGLGYLSLDRSTPSCSPGELQRLRLATQLASNLFGVIYVLDEPTAGLHPADGEALFEALHRLKKSGNSLFVVEHDIEMMRKADWLVDVGPEAGSEGGRILYSGPPDGLAEIAASRTGRYMFQKIAPPVSKKRAPQGWLTVENVSRNNLRGVTAAFPLECFTAVTGVSGSGKSSLVSQALLDLFAGHLDVRSEDADADLTLEDAVVESTTGTLGGDYKKITRVVEVDQKPIGRTPRSNLATYTGLFDQVRRLFAATPDARKRRFDAGRFSFNTAKGQCPTCEGAGSVSVELLFMPSVYAPCPACKGARYNEKTLEVKWAGKTIAEILDLTVSEALALFADEGPILRPLEVLRDIGLGYLKLGQPATELSGGEAQRIKLATELQRLQRGTTLYVLDEPTTGLHPRDIDRLLVQLNRLVDAGNTVIVVEHDMRTVAQCDWVIDMGPGAGDMGGGIVAAGTPAEIAKASRSRTGPYLRSALGIL